MPQSSSEICPSCATRPLQKRNFRKIKAATKEVFDLLCFCFPPRRVIVGRKGKDFTVEHEFFNSYLKNLKHSILYLLLRISFSTPKRNFSLSLLFLNLTWGRAETASFEVNTILKLLLLRKRNFISAQQAGFWSIQSEMAKRGYKLRILFLLPWIFLQMKCLTAAALIAYNWIEDLGFFEC